MKAQERLSRMEDVSKTSQAVLGNRFCLSAFASTQRVNALEGLCDTDQPRKTHPAVGWIAGHRHTKQVLGSGKDIW